AKLIHRDIKPENIFLIRHGQDEDFAKILDFGIAKPMAASDLDDGVKLTQAGMAFGTPIYMAPEQALGNPMDGRADLYAAATVAYEMLCGQPPFYSDDKLEVMAMHTARPVPPMRQRMIKGARPVPSSIERLVVRGLTKKPSDRYASAEEFLAEVERALRTPDGGVTDVIVERRRDTGAQPLVVSGGEVRITGETDFAAAGETVVDARDSIAEAIDDALTAPARAPGLARREARGGGFDFSDDDAPDHGAGHGRPDGIGALDALDGPELPTRPKLPKLPDTESDVGPSASGSSAELSRATPPAATPRGGVGLGLPYTGPHGVVFGLTPEQRLSATTPASAAAAGGAKPLEPARPSTAVPQVRRRFGLYLVIATCAIAIGVAGAVVTANLSRGDPAAIDPASTAGEASAALAQGDPARALKILDAARPSIAGDAKAQLVLGHVRASRNESGLALAAYERALTLTPDLQADDRLRAALRTMAGSTQDYTVVARAFDLWVVRTDDPEARKALLVSAMHDDLARRKAVRPVIERAHLGDSVDWLRVYSLDLQQEPTCELRRAAVAKLRALGDARAVTALERALVPTSRTPSYRGRRINECLAEDASAAIGFLRGLSRK
ncbi:MAG TPA: protein kinase, partial [Kofleriaceae bacterium]|nr:protein kinase [Kofleriaceae bacterium]